MSGLKLNPTAGAMLVLLWAFSGPAHAVFFVQCPGDADGDAVLEGAFDPNDPVSSDPDSLETTYFYPSDVRCKSITAGDSFAFMGDGSSKYFFSFHNVTGVQESDIGEEGPLAHEFPAPTIIQDEGDQYYLTLNNVGMVQRPDLADPHSVHYHGFPNAADIFDGVPEQTISINEGASFTYFYSVVEPGTYMWHCHVEATEHMQMGMLGNLYVRPAQNRLEDGTVLGLHVHSNPDNPLGSGTDRNQDDPLLGDKYVYNDGDGATLYDVEYPLQLGGWDGVFHDASRDTQPLPFAEMRDTYAMMNGRGYPATTSPGPIMPPPAETLDYGSDTSTQPVDSVIAATVGQRILLRISNLNVTRFHTVTALGLPPMQVIGRGARILRGGGAADGTDLFFATHTITLGGGEAHDVIIDTAGVEAGTYFLYTTNMQYLSNNKEDFGGMMTEIVISNPL